MTDNISNVEQFVINAVLFRELVAVVNSLSNGYMVQGSTMDARRILNACEAKGNVIPYEVLQEEIAAQKQETTQDTIGTLKAEIKKLNMESKGDKALINELRGDVNYG